ncbi:LysE family transporter [Rhizobium sp. CFBP 8762]|uniref:LysE family translocator n=1 Tax=Rhizobium sp. CFBP 8762 TaxID=2775279 RepID=UPI001785DC3B|nr:LysE family transporter [Rhizobium sp. CFBP 8762]MBD8556651.1 LysE family transporter [Rhizobium sp. CFBP 8762]
MTPLVEFIAAVLLLLLTPGPTNTLLSLSGASVGFVRSLRLIIGEVAGYLVIVFSVATLAAPFLAQHPAAALVMKTLAAIWIVRMAFHLWRNNADVAAANVVTPLQVFTTTLLNPKALIIGLVIMPHGTVTTVAPWLMLLTGLIVTAACLWITIGSIIGRSSSARLSPRVIEQVAACLLIVFSALLVSNVATSVLS